MTDSSWMTPGQREAMERFRSFISSDDETVFVLRGYAGTGKTTLLRSFVDYISDLGALYVLAASTGRAAKMLTLRTGMEAQTLHSLIYHFHRFGDSIKDLLEDEKEEHRHPLSDEDPAEEMLSLFSASTISDDERQWGLRVYFIDEASMISDRETKGGMLSFGSGNVLADLFKYDPEGKFVFVGDDSQLPPVGQDYSPALVPEYMEMLYDVRATGCQLTEIVRQDSQSGIVLAAADIRALYLDPPEVKWGTLPLKGYDDIVICDDQEALVRDYLTAIGDKDFDRCTFISLSNKRCAEVSRRARELYGYMAPVEVDDLLLVTQNDLTTGLANGDLIEVLEVSLSRKRVRGGVTFVPVRVRNIDDSAEYETLLILDLLEQDAPGLSSADYKALYKDFAVRMRKEGTKPGSRGFRKSLREDPYLNALHCRYGYALTCHKAQGGEWPEVFIDLPVWLMKESKSEAYRWVYTALTRARSVAHLAKSFVIK